MYKIITSFKFNQEKLAKIQLNSLMSDYNRTHLQDNKSNSKEKDVEIFPKLTGIPDDP